MAEPQEIEDVVDECVDALDPENFEFRAEALGLTVGELLQRIVNEMKARLE